MKKGLSIIGITLTLIVMLLSPVHAKEIIKCAECGMMVQMDSKFTSKITQGDTPLYFCDIGDLFTYLKRKNVQDARIEVKDYPSGEWIDARKAFYVKAAKKFDSPMGWGIAAFKDKNEASQSGSAMDFESTAKTWK
jgi:nitrous oxide reductase accessory protein NosL